MSAQVNQDFTDLVTFLNTNVVHVDGSKTMTGALTLAASDPASANQAARKSYVDQNARFKGAASGSIALSGSVQATDTQLLVKAGEQSTTTDALGAVVITFSTAFPTSLLGLWVTVANGSLFNNATSATNVPAFGILTQASLSAPVVKFFNGNAVIASSTSVAFSWLAVGN